MHKISVHTKFKVPPNDRGKLTSIIENGEIQSIRLHIIYSDGGEFIQDWLTDPICIKNTIKHLQETLKYLEETK